MVPFLVLIAVQHITLGQTLTPTQRAQLFKDGFQEYEGVYVSNEMVTYLKCLEKSGGNLLSVVTHTDASGKSYLEVEGKVKASPVKIVSAVDVSGSVAKQQEATAAENIQTAYGTQGPQECAAIAQHIATRSARPGRGTTDMSLKKKQQIRILSGLTGIGPTPVTINVAGYDGYNFYKVKVKFEPPFDEIPTVVPGLVTEDVWGVTSIRLGIRVEDVSVSGATLAAYTWSDTVFHSAGVSWIAYGR